MNTIGVKIHDGANKDTVIEKLKALDPGLDVGPPEHDRETTFWFTTVLSLDDVRSVDGVRLASEEAIA